MTAPLKLTELDASFLQRIDLRTHKRIHNFADADGLIFLCPKCFRLKGGRKGVHSVICWRPHVAAEIGPGPGRWEFRGTGLGDLTLVATASSIQITGGCNAHFFIRNGAIEMC